MDYSYVDLLNPVKRGDLGKLKTILNQASKKEQQDLISAHDYILFIQAAESGKKNVLELFFDCIPSEKHQEMIKAKSYSAFKLSERIGRKEILKLLLKKIPVTEHVGLLKNTKSDFLKKVREFVQCDKDGDLAKMENMLKGNKEDKDLFYSIIDRTPNSKFKDNITLKAMNVLINSNVGEKLPNEILYKIAKYIPSKNLPKLLKANPATNVVKKDKTTLQNIRDAFGEFMDVLHMGESSKKFVQEKKAEKGKGGAVKKRGRGL